MPIYRAILFIFKRSCFRAFPRVIIIAITPYVFLRLRIRARARVYKFIANDERDTVCPLNRKSSRIFPPPTRTSVVRVYIALLLLYNKPRARICVCVYTHVITNFREVVSRVVGLYFVAVALKSQ